MFYTAPIDVKSFQKGFEIISTFCAIILKEFYNMSYEILQQKCLTPFTHNKLENL